MSGTEKKLSDALRGLRQKGPQAAPRSLGERLQGEFQRHHSGRRKRQAVRFSLIAACLILSAGLSRYLRKANAPAAIAHAPIRRVAPAPQPDISAVVLKPKAAPLQIARKVAVKNGKPGSPRAADTFVMLPTFDPAIPIDHLLTIRLDLPMGALRQVGFPVSEDIAARRVLADFLVTQDGSPYALRFVQSSQKKEQWQ